MLIAGFFQDNDQEQEVTHALKSASPLFMIISQSQVKMRFRIFYPVIRHENMILCQ